MPFAKMNGVSLFYNIEGQGIPVVFVHPPTLTSSIFSYQVDGLSATFQTVVFDIRGHGHSSPSPEVVTYRTIADDLKELMDRLGLTKVFLCGYSTGGTVGLEFLLAYPERAYGAIVVGAMSEVHDLRLRLLILLGIAFTRVKAVNPLALSMAWSHSQNLHSFRTIFADAKQGNARNIMEYYQASLTYNCTQQLAYIRHPVLLVYGQRDNGFHSYAKLLKTHLPNSKLVYIRNTSHRVPTDASQALNQVILEFVQSVVENETMRPFNPV